MDKQFSLQTYIFCAEIANAFRSNYVIPIDIIGVKKDYYHPKQDCYSIKIEHYLIVDIDINGEKEIKRFHCPKDVYYTMSE